MVEAPVAFDLALLDLNVLAGPLLRHHELSEMHFQIDSALAYCME